jgi:uncharacterized iron-regulated protein
MVHHRQVAAALAGAWTLVVPFMLAGCCPRSIVFLDRTGGSAALFGQFAAYDGRTGRPLPFGAVVARSAAADVVLLGEEHSDAVCNQLEAQLLYYLAAQRRTALAMEFFEADAQAALDAYLHRRISEPEFRQQTRQNRAYVLAHRPLIELCRARGWPVLAANAPRRLVRAFRKSGLEYAEWRSQVDPQDRRWLPSESTHLGGAYEERFLEMMADHGASGAPAATQPAATQPADTQPAATQPAEAPASQPAESQPASQPVESQPATQAAESQPVEAAPSEPEDNSPAAFYRAQLVWDDAMAEALVNYRSRHPAESVLLIVGGFHVAAEGGTRQKFRARRPGDRVFTIIYRGTADPALAFDAADQGAGDVVIYGIKPPPEKSE